MILNVLICRREFESVRRLAQPSMLSIGKSERDTDDGHVAYTLDDISGFKNVAMWRRRQRRDYLTHKMIVSVQYRGVKPNIILSPTSRHKHIKPISMSQVRNQ